MTVTKFHTIHERLIMTNLSEPSISICIVTYNRDSDLLTSLSHFDRSEFSDFEILIVDNGNSQALPHLLEDEKFSFEFQLIQTSENLGCANLNKLFALARGEIIACFDDDSYPRSDCLKKIWELFQERSQLGMIGCKMHLPESGEPWHDRWWNPDSVSPQATVLCPGCGVAFRNDPRLPEALCVPDIVSQAHELSMAAEIARLGYEIEFRPDCVAYHPNTKIGYLGAKAENGALNQLRFLLRYADPTTLFLLRLTNWLVRLQGMPDRCRFIKEYLKKNGRSPLKRSTMRRFGEVLKWHIHPRLQRFI